jgi:hypothetical protein
VADGDVAGAIGSDSVGNSSVGALVASAIGVAVDGEAVGTAVDGEAVGDTAGVSVSSVALDGEVVPQHPR